MVFDSLLAWNQHTDDAVKYFSGTAVYSKTINIAADLLGEDRHLSLDLGRVAVMARVKLNGHDLGVLWKAPYRAEIDQFAKPGDNLLEVEVTNLWINRMIGDENLPEDSDRNGDGTLRVWPKWISEGKPSPTGRQTFTSWRLYRKGGATPRIGPPGAGDIAVNAVCRAAVAGRESLCGPPRATFAAALFCSPEPLGILTRPTNAVSNAKLCRSRT